MCTCGSQYCYIENIKFPTKHECTILEFLITTSCADVKRRGSVRGFSIRKVFFGTTMTLSTPKAFLICSLLTTHLTKAAIINSLCSVGAGEWNDWNISVASGIAFSGRSEEVLWKLNNVRSTRNKISAILGHNKRRLADVKLFGTGSWDWEAIAANRENGTSYIYLADIGDKRFERWSSMTIYKFKEPRVSHRWHGRYKLIPSRNVKRILVKYPGHICQGMAVDPLNGDILIFTKSHQRRASMVFKVPQGSGDSRTKTLEYVTTLPNNMLVTAADMSPTGDILYLSNTHEGWRWRKPDSLMSWTDFFKTKPTWAPIPCQHQCGKK